ncbi:MAG: hypothetical protein JW816_02495 [Candidatus Buchananbacteria bacterium]|nr:hypothetical protein [Candidatus Buchananbacteria bacterium]
MKSLIVVLCVAMMVVGVMVVAFAGVFTILALIRANGRDTDTPEGRLDSFDDDWPDDDNGGGDDETDDLDPLGGPEGQARPWVDPCLDDGEGELVGVGADNDGADLF